MWAAWGWTCLQPLRVARGWGRQGHPHRRLGKLSLGASDICATPTKMTQRFIGLSGIFARLCYKAAHNTAIWSAKMQFSCRPRDAGRVANNATCSNRKILVKPTQSTPEEHADCWIFLTKSKWEVQGDGMAGLKMHRWKDGCLPETGFHSFQTAGEQLKCNLVYFRIIALQFSLPGNLEFNPLLWFCSNNMFAISTFAFVEKGVFGIYLFFIFFRGMRTGEREKEINILSQKGEFPPFKAVIHCCY